MATIPINDPNALPSGESDFISSVFGVEYHINDLGLLVSRIATWALALAGVFMFLCVIISGLQILISGGDKAGMEKSKKRITNCLIGLTVISLSWAIMLVINYFFGLEIL